MLTKGSRDDAPESSQKNAPRRRVQPWPHGVPHRTWQNHGSMRCMHLGLTLMHLGGSSSTIALPRAEEFGPRICSLSRRCIPVFAHSHLRLGRPTASRRPSRPPLLPTSAHSREARWAEPCPRTAKSEQLQCQSGLSPPSRTSHLLYSETGACTKYTASTETTSLGTSWEQEPTAAQGEFLRALKCSMPPRVEGRQEAAGSISLRVGQAGVPTANTCGARTALSTKCGMSATSRLNFCPVAWTSGRALLENPDEAAASAVQVAAAESAARH